MASLETEVTEELEQGLRTGFRSLEAICEEIVELLGEEYGAEEVQAVIDAVAPNVVADLAREKESWPAVTDCDRLDAAFEELNAMGVMARHCWACCGTCGAEGMREEYERLSRKKNGEPIAGYTFYDHQDTDMAVREEGIYLNYGTSREDIADSEIDAESIAIGRRVCEVIERHGLRTTWDGSMQYRIKVHMDWKRRKAPEGFVASRRGECW